MGEVQVVKRIDSVRDLEVYKTRMRRNADMVTQPSQKGGNSKWLK